LASLVLLCGVAAADQVARLADARDPDTMREAALQLGKALDDGCCFGREREIARIAEWQLARCPRDPALLSALAAMLGTIGHSVVLEDRALARRVFVERPRTCIANATGAWQAYAELLMHGGLVLAESDPQALTKAIMQLIESAQGNRERIRQIVQWLDRFNLESGTALPPLDQAAVDALIDAAGNSLYKLPDLFSRLSGRAAIDALLRLAGRRDLAVPPELAQWADAGDIRSDALRKLERRRLQPQDLAQVRRLAADPDGKVARAAKALLASAAGGQRHGGSAAGDGHGAEELERLMAELRSGDRSARTGAAWRLAEYLRAHPNARRVRKALRHAASTDGNALVRARAWGALLATGDRRFTWRRLLDELRSPAGRERMLETLRLFELPVASELLQGLPDALPQALLEIAASERNNTGLRVKALEAARGLGAWALDLLSRSHVPSAAQRKATDHARARAFLDRFSRLTEPRVRALLGDPDPSIRRAAAYWFAAIPAREPATAEALLAALDDPNEFVRDNAAMAIAAVRAAPPGFAARLEARIARGDPDANVVARLRDARAAMLCADPQVQDRLAAVILHREGDRFLRQALASRCRLEEAAARSLLERLDGALVHTLAATGEWPPSDLVRAEEDPAPWSLVRRMVPASVRDAWLLERAAASGWKDRLALLTHVENRHDPKIRRQLLDWLVEGVRTGAIDADAYLRLFAPLGYASIRALAEALARDAQGLARATALVEAADNLATRCAAAGSSCGRVPGPGAQDIEWIAQSIRSAAQDMRRLGLLVRLLRLYHLGQDPESRRKAWEAGITPILLEAMKRPGGCEAVRPAIHSLIGRMTPPQCR